MCSLFLLTHFFSVSKSSKKFSASGGMQIVTPTQILRLAASSEEEKISWLKAIDDTWSRIIDNERTRKFNSKSLEEPHIDFSSDFSLSSSLSGSLYEKEGGKWRTVFCRMVHSHLLVYPSKEAKCAEKAIFILKSTFELQKKTKWGYSFVIKLPDYSHTFGAEGLNTVFSWFKCARILIRSAIEVEKKTVLQEIVSSDEANRYCAECGMNVQFANLALGVFLCVQCSEIHKTLLTKDMCNLVSIREEVSKEKIPPKVCFFSFPCLLLNKKFLIPYLRSFHVL